jgi:type I restriction enzyme M protein
MTFLERAIEDGHAKLSGEGKTRKITYVAVNWTERFNDPEETVRAEFWAELLYRYGYEAQRIGIEVVVPDRTPSDRADVVIFRDDERKRPYAAIECKRDGITDSEFKQAVEQAFGNATWTRLRAEYTGVVAGKTRQFFDCSDKFGALEREKNIVADLPRQYGKPLEYKFYKGGVRFEAVNRTQVEAPDIEPVSREELITAIRKCHQTLWGGGRLSPPAAFGELCKIIFVKIRDEQAPRKEGEPYEFQIKTNEASHSLARRIRELYAIEQRREPGVFNDTIRVEDAVLRTVVSHLESISLNETDLDTKGVAFEQFMDSFFKGDFGQYFTPRELISFAIDMLPPQRDDFVLDPACGSGGFLLYAMDHIRREAQQYSRPGSAEHFRYWHDFAQQHLFGIDINDEIARVAKMNMIIHDDGHTNVIRDDALNPINRIHEQNAGFNASKFDLVLTNPPFGAMVKMSEKPYLADFELSRYAGKSTTGAEPPDDSQDFNSRKKAIKQRTSVKTEILFCERVWQFLKPGTGRAAIVLPDGILTNSSLQPIRDWLLDRFQILAVVSLPQFAFSHYGAGVKASIVFLRKRADAESPSDDEPIFMAAPARIGYDATGRKTPNDLPEVARQYRAFKEHPEPFFV